MLISQTTDSHFANNRFSFRKLQIFISQSTDFHFVSFHFVSFHFVSLHFVSQSTVSRATRVLKHRDHCDTQINIGEGKTDTSVSRFLTSIVGLKTIVPLA